MPLEDMVIHSDLNSFYASVEIMLNPALRGKAVAVCGSTESRHGIVLAKSELAKKAGVKTGMANWEARVACPNLIMVPPQYDQYVKYSRLAHCTITGEFGQIHYLRGSPAGQVERLVLSGSFFCFKTSIHCLICIKGEATLSE